VLRSSLRPRTWTLLPQERFWGWIGPQVHPRLEALRVDLGPALGDLRRVLPLFARRAEQERAGRLAASVRLESVRAEGAGVVVGVRFDVPDEAPAAAAVEAPDAPLSPEELAALVRVSGRVDAFLTFVIKQAGRDAAGAALREELLDVLLDARHELVRALAGPVARGEDPVRAVFRRAWTRLAPLLRRASAGELPAESALRYLSFVAAGDALAALEAAAPAFGIELSSQGLRRLARTLAPKATEDPLSRSREVDPELRAIFGFGPPLPAPEPAPEAAPGVAPEAPHEPGGDAAPERAPEPAPDGAPEPAPEAGPEVPAEPPPASRLAPLGRALVGLFLAAPAAAVPGAGPDRSVREIARRLNRWAPSRDDASDYLPLAGRLLRAIAAELGAPSGLAAAQREVFDTLVPAAAWQESCWRQYVVRNDRLVPLRSRTGDVGIMQVNERVWRGFYQPAGLRWDVAYNGRAGGEILLHYLRDAALRGRVDRHGPEALARATYAMYNGGPDRLRPWRGAAAPAPRGVDAAFASKYRTLAAGDDAAILRCFTG
jgi:hypothetical protein